MFSLLLRWPIWPHTHCQTPILHPATSSTQPTDESGEPLFKITPELTTATDTNARSSFSGAERIAYTTAVKCLISKLSITSPLAAPGARTRYDDFVAVHINQTLTIHGTANFLSWHCYFLWTYEQALRTECAYTGYQPYWNWGKTAFDPLNSPMYDGSATSMGGNGIFAPHNCTDGLPTLAAPDVTPPSNPLAYNPRCLRRDVSSWVSSNWTRDIDSYNLITANNDIGSFQTLMQGDFDAGSTACMSGGISRGAATRAGICSRVRGIRRFDCIMRRLIGRGGSGRIIREGGRCWRRGRRPLRGRLR